jgi:hypothetical protein
VICRDTWIVRAMHGALLQLVCCWCCFCCCFCYCHSSVSWYQAQSVVSTVLDPHDAVACNIICIKCVHATLPQLYLPYWLLSQVHHTSGI